MQDTTLESLAESPQFCLSKGDDGSLHLKHNHAYYYQCQLQLYATQRLYCDFVIWTESGLHIERITEDETFLNNIIPRAERFFKLCVLPELLGKWFTRSHSRQVPCDISDNTETEEDSGMWCYCRESKGGDMICCENKSCSVKWFT